MRKRRNTRSYTLAKTQNQPNTLSTHISSVGVAFGVDQHFQTIWVASTRCKVGCCFAVLP